MTAISSGMTNRMENRYMWTWIERLAEGPEFSKSKLTRCENYGFVLVVNYLSVNVTTKCKKLGQIGAQYKDLRLRTNTFLKNRSKSLLFET